MHRTLTISPLVLGFNTPDRTILLQKSEKEIKQKSQNCLVGNNVMKTFVVLFYDPTKYMFEILW